MSKTYTKEIITTQKVDFMKCDKCGIETQVCLAIDNWCKTDDEIYCRECQKKYKVGWYEPKIK